MSQKYFDNFRMIYYNGQLSRNIVMKAQFFRNVLDTYSAFYPYTIRDGDTVEHVAYKYYGNANYDWLVYFSNEIIDPYFAWPMNYSQFQKYLYKKYNNSIDAIDDTIMYYAYDPTVDTQDIGYEYKINYQMAADTYNALTPIEKGFWKPVYALEYETALNESRRNIQLFNNELVNRVEQEISRIFV